MKSSFSILAITLFVAICSLSCQKSKDKAKCEGPLITKADSLSCDTSRCNFLCNGPFKTKEDSLACATYCGNSNPNPTDGWGYFDLILDDVSYHFPGVLTQNADGWKYGASLVNGVAGAGFAIQGDIMKQNPSAFRLQFHFNYEAITGPGTYVIPKMDDAHPFQFVAANINPSGTMPPDFLGDATILDMKLNSKRVKNGDDCDETEIAVASQTLVITKWANAGQIVEGTMSGTLYENFKTLAACKDSKPVTYTGSFKIKRRM